MSKSLRSFVLVAALSVIAVPTMKAERTGCDPHPQIVAAPISQLGIIIYTVMSSLSL